MGYISRVKDGVGTHLVEPTLYAECKTAAATATKQTAAIDNFSLVAGVQVAIKFTITNTAVVDNLKLQIGTDTTTAKSIKYRGGSLPSAGTLAANHIYNFVYDGTNWELVGDLDTDTQSNYGNITTSGKIGIGNNLVVTSSGTVQAGAIISSAISTQTTSTKFLREDGTWAVPSYTTNTDEKVSQIGSADDKNFPIILKNTDGANETSGVKYSNNTNTDVTKTKPFTFNPSTGTLTVSQIKIGTKDDKMGLFPNLNNWNQIGSGSLYWFRAYINNYYGNNSHITNWDAGKNIGTAATSSAAATKGSVNFYNTAAAGTIQTKTLLEANSATGTNITITLPSSTGNLALISDIPTKLSDLEKDLTYSDFGAAAASHGTHVTTATVKSALGIVGTTAKKFLKDTGDWVQVAYTDLTGVPTSFTPAEHDHNTLYPLKTSTTITNGKATKLTFTGGFQCTVGVTASNSHARAYYKISGYGQSDVRITVFELADNPQVKYYIPDDEEAIVFCNQHANNVQALFIVMDYGELPTITTNLTIPSSPNYLNHHILTEDNYKFYAWARPASITTDQVLISSGTAGETTLRGIYTLGTTGGAGWGTEANHTKIPDMSFIAYWNGTYSGTNSNLEYYKGGAFGTMAKENANDYAKLSSAAFTGAVTVQTPTADMNPATKQYVDTQISAGFAANDAMVFKGVLNKDATETATTLKNVPKNGYSAGWTYKVAVAGTYAGATCEIGDMVIAVTDAASNQSAVNNAHWNVIQTNIDGSVTSSSVSSTDNAIARFDGTSGRIIQNSGAKIDDDGNIVLTSGNAAITNTDNKRLSWRLSDGTMRGYFTISSEGKVGIHGCQELYFRPGNTNNAISTETGTVLTNSAFYPYANEGLSLGLSDSRWTTLYAATNILVGNYNFTAYNTNNKPGVYIGPEIISISQQTRAGTRGFWLIGNGQKDYARLYINALGTASTAESSPGADDGTQGAVGDVILILGNSTARGAKNTTDGLGNARGRLRLHGTTENYIDLYTQDQTTNGRAIFLPDSDHANPVLIPSYDLSGAQDLNTKYNAGIYCIEGGSVTNYPSGSTAYANLLVLPYRRPQGNTKPDFALQIYGHSTNRLWFRGSDSNNWRAWRELVHVATNTGAGSTNTPVYIDTDGTVTAVSKYLATHVSGGSEEIQIKYSTTIDYWWGVGTSNENHGLYDNKANQWIVYAAADNNWSFTGNAATATSATTAKYTKQYYTVNSTDAPLQIRSTNADVYIWQAGHATAANGTFSNHYALQYCGSGTSPDNYLILKASNGGTPTDAIKIDELGNTTFTNIYTTKINSVSNNATYINGQKPGSSAYQINDYSGTGGYFSWMRATNTWASGDENAKVGRYFSFGTLGTSFYLMGSVSTRTSNGYDHALRYNTSSGKLFCDDVEVSLDGHTHNNYLPLTGGTMTDAITFTSQGSAFNDKNILFSSGGRIGGNTSGDIGIYSNTTIYLKPDSTSTSSTTKGVLIDNTGLYPVSTGSDYYLGTSANKWNTVYSTILDSSIIKLHQGTAANPSTSSNARIEFDYSGGQPVYLAYTPNDSVHVPAGLKIMGNGSTSGSNFSSPAWLEVEGTVYAAAFSGNATTATTATYSTYPKIVSSNEIRFSANTKPSTATDIHIGHAWSDGSRDAKISGYRFKDGNGNLTQVYASVLNGSITTYAAPVAIEHNYILMTTTTPSSTSTGTAVTSTRLLVNAVDQGKFELVLGNNTPTSTAGGQYGQLALYSASSAGTYLKAADGTSWFTATLQAKTGTIALTSDIPTSMAWGNITSKPTKITLTGSVTGSVDLGNGELTLATTTNHNHDDAYAPIVTGGYLPLSGGTMTGTITLATAGIKTNNTAGYSIDQYGNFKHQRTLTGDRWQLLSNGGAINFNYSWESGDLTIAGALTATNGFVGDVTGNATTLSHTLSTNTKYYISGTTLTATGTSAATFDSNLYTTTIPGELSALRYSLHSGSVEKTYITYNATDDSLDFVFV